MWIYSADQNKNGEHKNATLLPHADKSTFNEPLVGKPREATIACNFSFSFSFRYSVRVGLNITGHYNNPTLQKDIRLISLVKHFMLAKYHFQY